MNYLIKVLMVVFVLSILSGCGSSGGGAGGAASTNDNDASCPKGEYYSTNGNRDYIFVGNDGAFSMERVGGASASGYISCIGGQSFLLTIEESVGNCDEAAQCIGMDLVHTDEDIYYNVQGAGIYTCSFSIANYTFSVRCTGATAKEGNFFSTSKTYFLPGYY